MLHHQPRTCEALQVLAAGAAARLARRRISALHKAGSAGKLATPAAQPPAPEWLARCTRVSQPLHEPPRPAGCAAPLLCRAARQCSCSRRRAIGAEVTRGCRHVLGASAAVSSGGGHVCCCRSMRWRRRQQVAELVSACSTLLLLVLLAERHGGCCSAGRSACKSIVHLHHLLRLCQQRSRLLAAGSCGHRCQQLIHVQRHVVCSSIAAAPRLLLLVLAGGARCCNLPVRAATTVVPQRRGAAGYHCAASCTQGSSRPAAHLGRVTDGQHSRACDCCCRPGAAATAVGAAARRVRQASRRGAAGGDGALGGEAAAAEAAAVVVVPVQLQQRVAACCCACQATAAAGEGAWD